MFKQYLQELASVVVLVVVGHFFMASIPKTDKKIETALQTYNAKNSQYVVMSKQASQERNVVRRIFKRVIPNDSRR